VLGVVIVGAAVEVVIVLLGELVAVRIDHSELAPMARGLVKVAASVKVRL